MRHRCLVVSSRFSSLPEVCAGHAAYFDDYAPEAMAATVSRAVEAWHKDSPQADAALRHSLSFNYQHYTQQYVALYRQLLDAR